MLTEQWPPPFVIDVISGKTSMELKLKIVQYYMNVYYLVSQISTQKKKKNCMYLIIAFYTPNTIYTSRDYFRIIA